MAVHCSKDDLCLSLFMISITDFVSELGFLRCEFYKSSLLFLLIKIFSCMSLLHYCLCLYVSICSRRLYPLRRQPKSCTRNSKETGMCSCMVEILSCLLQKEVMFNISNWQLVVGAGLVSIGVVWKMPSIKRNNLFYLKVCTELQCI